MGETLSNWIVFIVSMVFIVGFFRLAAARMGLHRDRLAALGILRARWLIYSRRYDKVHDFIAEADRRRRQPVAGLVEKPKEEPPPQPRDV